MEIRCARPIEGRRERLCRTDEATVSKVFTKDGRELVERLQPFSKHSEVHNDNSGFFYLKETPNHIPYTIPASSKTYHLYKFLALRVARAMYPKNFVDCSEIRFFRDRETRKTATYSEFVPDESGVLERRAASMKRYYATEDKQAREQIKREFDIGERLINGNALTMAWSMPEARGLGIPHPEANHHVYDGNIVFFEVSGIDLAAALRFSVKDDNVEALHLVSLMYAIFLRVHSDKSMEEPHRRLNYPGLYESYHEQDMEAIYRAIFAIHMSSDKMDLKIISDLLHTSFADLERYSRLCLRLEGVLPSEITLQEGRDIDRILRDQY